MTFEHSELEFEPVKFCPECGSDNIQVHPDDSNYDGRWLKCYDCGREFQAWDAEAMPPSDHTLWERRLTTC